MHLPEWISTQFGVQDHSQNVEIMPNLMNGTLRTPTWDDLNSNAVQNPVTENGLGRVKNLCGILRSLVREDRAQEVSTKLLLLRKIRSIIHSRGLGPGE